MKDLKAMLGKKPKESDSVEKDAKMNALQELRKMASGMGQDGLKGRMDKVTVAAKNPEDLKQGLDKAKEIVGQADELKDALDPHDEAMDEAEELTHEDLDEDNEAGESPSHIRKLMDFDHAETPESIEEQIKALEAKKQAMLLKK